MGHLLRGRRGERRRTGAWTSVSMFGFLLLSGWSQVIQSLDKLCDACYIPGAYVADKKVPHTGGQTMKTWCNVCLGMWQTYAARGAEYTGAPAPNGEASMYGRMPLKGTGHDVNTNVAFPPAPAPAAKKK